MSSETEFPIITQVYDIYKTTYSINEKLPRRARYGLGHEAETTTMNLLKLLIKAKNCSRVHRSAYLLSAQAELETLRFQLRLYIELDLANTTRIMQLQAVLQSVGKQLGGWLKSSS